MSDIYRLATLDDSEELLGVILRAYETIRALGIKFPAAYADIEMVRDTVASHECYVLERDGSIIATVTISEPVEQLKAIADFPFIMKFAVEPAFKGQGIGDRLLTWVEADIARDKWQAKAVTLGTAERHPWLVPMYERRGYERIYEIETEDDGKMVLLKKQLIRSERSSSNERLARSLS